MKENKLAIVKKQLNLFCNPYNSYYSKMKVTYKKIKNKYRKSIKKFQRINYKYKYRPYKGYKVLSENTVINVLDSYVVNFEWQVNTKRVDLYEDFFRKKDLEALIITNTIYNSVLFNSCMLYGKNYSEHSDSTDYILTFKFSWVTEYSTIVIIEYLQLYHLNSNNYIRV